MDNALWCRHWLEVRNRLPGLAILALVNGSFVLFRPGNFGRTDPRYQQFLGTPLAHSMGADNLFIWAALVQIILAFGPIVALVLTGNGISSLGPATPASYTLTLPVSRFRLIWTRMAAGSLAAILIVVIELTFGYAMLLAQGRVLPIVPFALSAAFYAPTLVACTAVMGALLIIHQGAAIVGSLAMFVLSAELNQRTITSLLARGEMPWIAMSALLATTGLAFMVTVLMSRRKEF